MFRQYISKLTDAGEITCEDAELYLYGWKELKNRIFNFMIVLTVGYLTESMAELISLSIFFILLRSFSGGYHAPGKVICLICSLGSLVLAAFTVPYMTIRTLGHVIFAICTIIIYILSPVGALNKPLDEKEISVYRKISIILTSIYLILYIGSVTLDFHILRNVIWFTMCFQAMLLIFGKLLHLYSTYRE